MADPPAASPMAALRPPVGPKDPSPRMFEGQRESRNPNEDGVESSTFAFHAEELLPDDLNSLLKASGAAIAEEKRKNEQNRAKKPFSTEFYSTDLRAELGAEMQTNEATPDKSKPSPFSRKAQRFSSLKKKKVSSTLLNKVFGNSGSDVSQKSSDRDDEVLEKSCSLVDDEGNGSTGHGDNRVPPEASAEAAADAFASACGGGFAGVVESARDNLTLYAEDEVRQAIQSTLNEVIGMTCMTTKSPAHANTQVKQEQMSDESGKKLNPATTSTGNSVYERFVACASSPPRNSTTPNKHSPTPGKLVIPALFANSASKSLFPTSVDKAFSRSPVKNTETTPKKSTTTDASSKTSKCPKQISLVETESEDEVDEDISVGSTSGCREISNSPPPVETVVAASPQHQPSQLKPVTSPALVRIVPSCEDLYTVKEVSTNGSASVEESRQDSILLIEVDDNDEEDDAAFLPYEIEELVRQEKRGLRKMTSEELDQHINEALAKAEAEWNDPFGKESRSQIEYAVEDALRAAHRQFQLQEDELLLRHQQELAELKDHYTKKLAEQKDQLTLANRMAHARQIEIERLENNGESTKREKELATLRNELKVLQQEKDEMTEKLSSQVNALQGELSEAKSQLTRKEAEINSLDHMPKDEADSLREQSSKLEATREELRQEKERVKESEQQFSATSNTLSRVQKELETALADKEALQAQHAVIPAELLRVQKELKMVKAKLSKYETTSTDSVSLAKQLADVTKELEETKAAQRKVEEDLEESASTVKRLQEELQNAKKNQESKPQEVETIKKSPTKTPTRRDSTGNLPNPRLYRPNNTPRTPVRSPNRSGTTPTGGTPSKKSPSLRNHAEDLHEKEKESLRQQVALLEEQILKRNEEHERALKEIRIANEEEIIGIKKEYEHRVEQKAEKGRELKENLSVAEGQEREDLLEKIESLEASKKADRNDGLREVQKKEELLQRVTALEKREKELIEEHERVMQEIRIKNDAEIKQLRDTLEEQINKFRATENELRQTISETSSYDKEELLQKVDRLQSQLESERSSALLVKMKVTTAEKDAVQALHQHQSEVKKLKEDIEAETEKFMKERDAKVEIENELKELKSDLDNTQKELMTYKERFQKESAAQKATFESRLKEIQDLHTKELDDLLAQLDLVEAEHTQNIEAKEQLVREKESQIQTLSVKLEEMELKVKAHQKIEKTWTIKLENSEKLAKKSEEALVQLQEQYDSFKKEHDRFVSEAEVIKERACKASENRMIERAEKQFKQANDLYVKLKKQYDLVKSNAERLESELKEAKKSNANITKEKDDRLIELSRELAELKIAKDNMEKESAQKAKDYRKEMQGLLKAAEEFENKFEEAEATSSSLQKALSKLESQKAKLQSEYDELHKVCDELMAHMEAQEKQHEC